MKLFILVLAIALHSTPALSTENLEAFLVDVTAQTISVVTLEAQTTGRAFRGKLPRRGYLVPLDGDGTKAFPITSTKEGLHRLGKKATAATTPYLVKGNLWGISESAVDQWLKEEKFREVKFFLGARIATKTANSATHHRRGILAYYQRDLNKARLAFVNSRKQADLAAEADYYLGVIAFESNQKTDAKKAFQNVVGSKRLDLKPSAHFYLGKLAEEVGDELSAQTHYRYVKLNGASESVREQASVRLDLIERELAYENRLADKFSGQLRLDILQYDSNVQNLPISTNTVTNQGGFGFGGGLDLRYQFISNEATEWSGTYGFSANMHPDEVFANNDQWNHSFGLPFLSKGVTGGLPYRFGMTPGVSITQSNIDGVSRFFPNSNILNTYSLNSKYTVTDEPMSLWDYSLGFRYEDSKSTVAGSDDYASGFAFTPGITRTWYCSSDKSSGVTFGGSFDWFFGRGRNLKHFKLSAQTSYFRPVMWKFNGEVSFSAGWDKFHEHVNGRRDYFLSGSLNLSRSIMSAVNFQQAFSVNRNFSNLSTNTYFRFTSLSSLTYAF